MIFALHVDQEDNLLNSFSTEVTKSGNEITDTYTVENHLQRNIALRIRKKFGKYFFLKLGIIQVQLLRINCCGTPHVTPSRFNIIFKSWCIEHIVFWMIGSS